jgi:hypothetical protein
MSAPNPLESDPPARLLLRGRQLVLPIGGEQQRPLGLVPTDIRGRRTTGRRFTSPTTALSDHRDLGRCHPIRTCSVRTGTSRSQRPHQTRTSNGYGSPGRREARTQVRLAARKGNTLSGMFRYRATSTAGFAALTRRSAVRESPPKPGRKLAGLPVVTAVLAGPVRCVEADRASPSTSSPRPAASSGSRVGSPQMIGRVCSEPQDGLVERSTQPL